MFVDHLDNKFIDLENHELNGEITPDILSKVVHYIKSIGFRIMDTRRQRLISFHCPSFYDKCQDNTACFCIDTEASEEVSVYDLLTKKGN
jgi:hypothetical protein